MGILKMAWRNIGRNRRRTVVTVAAMAFGFFAMVVWFAMLQGLLADMERTVIDVEIGDLQIHAPTYLDDPSLYTRIDDVDTLIPALEAAGFRASATASIAPRSFSTTPINWFHWRYTLRVPAKNELVLIAENNVVRRCALLCDDRGRRRDICDPRVMARARRLVRLVDGRIESDDARG